MKYATALYGRTSRDDAKRLTIEIQQTALRSWSTTDPLVESVVDEFWDADVSGKRPLWERPAGARMLEGISAGRIKSVAVVYLDRFGRTLLDSLQAAARLEQQGVKLVAVNDGWDARRDDDPLYFHIRAAIAESEHRRIKRRTEDGRKRASERDNAPPGGSLIFGYRMGPNGAFLIDPVEAAIVRQVFSLAASGDSHSAILAWLEQTGVSPGRRWQKRIPGADVRIASHHASASWRHSRVGQILRCRAYIGERTYGGTVYPVPPIVDRDTWDRVQEICTRYKRQRAHGPQKGLLSGLLRCSMCGGTYHYMSNKTYEARYTCTGRRQGRCAGARLPVTPTDETVWGLVREWLSDPASVIREASVACGRAEDSLAAIETEEARIAGAVERIDGDVKNLWAEQTSHGWPFAWIAGKLDVLNGERKRLLAEQDSLRSRRAAVSLDKESIASLMETIKAGSELWLSGDETRAEVIRRHVTAVEVRPNGHGVIHYGIGLTHFLDFPTTCSTQPSEASFRLPFRFLP